MQNKKINEYIINQASLTLKQIMHPGCRHKFSAAHSLFYM